jgi:photosystem II stability/assembly factor-like uncharacterized protein
VDVSACLWLRRCTVDRRAHARRRPRRAHRGFDVLQTGAFQFFTATALLSDGTTSDRTGSATWTSTNPAVAQVVAGGRVTSVAPGTATIQAVVDGLTATQTVTVAAPAWQFLGAPTLTTADTGVEHLAVDPRDEATLYTGTSKGLYVTRNGGGSWTMPINSGLIDAIALDPTNADRVYVLAKETTLFRSDDRGATFTTVTTFADPVRSLRISARTQGTIYIGFGGLNNPNPSGVFRSTDNGTTWTRHPFGVSGALIPWDIGEDSSDGTLYVGTEIADHPQPYHPQFFASTDGGDTWLDRTGILPWHVLRITVNQTNHQVFALTEGTGLYTSIDHANTWTKTGATFGLSILLDPQHTARMFGGDFDLGENRASAFVSGDSGLSFFPYGLEGRQIGALALNGTSTRLYATCIGSGIYMTNIPQP